MALTWVLNEKHDITITGSGKLQTVTSATEVRQRILTTLWHYWREYFLNVPGGVPWYELILGSKDRKTVESLLRKTVLDVPGVLSVLKFQVSNSSTDPRKLEVSMDVETIYEDVVRLSFSAPDEPVLPG